MRKFVQFLNEAGIGAPGALPPGGGPMPPPGAGGGPPPLMGGGGMMGGGMPPMPPGPGLGGPMGGGAGGDLTGKKPLQLKPLNVWEVLEKILKIDDDESDETPIKKPEKKQLKYLQS